MKNSSAFPLSRSRERVEHFEPRPSPLASRDPLPTGEEISFVIIAALLFTACGPVDLSVISVPDAGSIAPLITPCSGTSDCLADEFCDKTSCGDALGECAQRPLACGDDVQPECGCDGVTYMNDCLRRLSGIEAIFEHGPCHQPMRCDPQTPCPGESKCARVGPPGSCGMMMRGACWRVASTCAASTDEHYMACGPSQCLDLCGAVNSGMPTERYPGPCP